MAGQDLIDSIKQRLSQGETRESIRQFYLSKGWQEDDIEAVFETIPQVTKADAPAPIQLPFSSVWSKWDAKTSNLPAVMIMGFFACCAVIVLLIAILLYFILDPFGSRIAARDVVRDQEVTQTEQALQRYFDKHAAYPGGLNALLPDFLRTIPLDPSTQKPLQYSLFDKVNYQLCVNFELKPYQCFTGR